MTSAWWWPGRRAGVVAVLLGLVLLFGWVTIDLWAGRRVYAEINEAVDTAIAMANRGNVLIPAIHFSMLVPKILLTEHSPSHFTTHRFASAIGRFRCPC